MVSIFTILALCFSLLACLVFPIVLCIVFMKKNRPGFLPLVVGIFIFILFALVLEQLMHYLFMYTIPATKTLLANNVWVYAVYGALAAGIFEEGGRRGRSLNGLFLSNFSLVIVVQYSLNYGHAANLCSISIKNKDVCPIFQ